MISLTMRTSSKRRASPFLRGRALFHSTLGPPKLRPSDRSPKPTASRTRTWFDNGFSRNSAPNSVMKRARKKFPKGWNERKIKDLIRDYENQTEDEEFAEVEAARQAKRLTFALD